MVIDDAVHLSATIVDRRQLLEAMVAMVTATGKGRVVDLNDKDGAHVHGAVYDDDYGPIASF